jgi:acetyl-CoA carboxylase alpha subunit
LIDDEGARTDKAQKAFTLHDDASFQKAFSEIVKTAYSDLFNLHGDDAWALDDSKLITFFRQTDQSSQLVGSRQASTFKALASYAGHVSPAASTKPKTAKARPSSPSK